MNLDTEPTPVYFVHHTHTHTYTHILCAIQSVVIVASSTVVMSMVVVVVAKVSVWDAAIINIVVGVEVIVIGVLIDVQFIDVGVLVVIDLKFALSVSYSVCVSSDVAVDLFVDVLTGIGIEVLADANANIFAVPVSSP